MKGIKVSSGSRYDPLAGLRPVGCFGLGKKEWEELTAKEGAVYRSSDFCHCTSLTAVEGAKHTSGTL